MSYLFLTTKPVKRQFHTSMQRDFIYVLSNTDYLPRLVIKMYYKDGTNDYLEFQVSNFRKSFAFQVPLDWSQIIGKQPTKTISKFSVYIDNFEPEAITFYPVESKGDSQRVFYYRNSLGGFDSLVCNGDFQEEISSQHNIIKRQLPLNHNYLLNEYGVKSSQSSEVFTTFSGYKPKSEILSLKDMIHNNELYEYKDQNLIQCMLISNKLVLQSEFSNLKSVSFQYRQSIDIRALNQVT